MSRFRIFRFALPLAAILPLANQASADVYCAVDGPDLQNKLNAAAASADDDVIRLRIGSFLSNGGAEGFTYLSSNSGSLTLSGSWSGSQANPNACLSQYENSLTWVHGDTNRRALTLSMTSMTPGTVTLEKIKFEGGTSATGGIGGCASIVSPNGEVVLSGNWFYGCLAPFGDGGGLYLQAKSAHIINNVFHDNAARRGGAMLVDARGGAFYMNNNTVTGNLAETLVGASGGVQFITSGIDGSDSVLWASNNILWGNSAGTDRYDIDISGLATNAAGLRYNHIGRLKGTAAPGSGQTTTGDPLFVGAANEDFALSPGSPARNSGNSYALGGVGTFDIEGKKRVQGAAVDRGAIEFDELFGNGFD